MSVIGRGRRVARRRAALLGPLTLVLVASLAGCSAEDASPTADPAGSAATQPTSPSASAQEPNQPSETASPAPSETPPETSTGAPATAPADFDGSTTPGERSAGQGSGAYDLVLADVRTGRHDGYDRVVMEFRGSGVPGYQVRYETDPRLEGSGERVRLDGDAALVITADHTTYPAEDADYYDGPNRLSGPGSPLSEVFVGATFEGYTDIYAGLTGGPAPYRVLRLTGPPRLVVDVVSGS